MALIKITSLGSIVSNFIYAIPLEILSIVAFIYTGVLSEITAPTMLPNSIFKVSATY